MPSDEELRATSHHHSGMQRCLGWGPVALACRQSKFLHNSCCIWHKINHTTSESVNVQSTFVGTLFIGVWTFRSQNLGGYDHCFPCIIAAGDSSIAFLSIGEQIGGGEDAISQISI